MDSKDCNQEVDIMVSVIVPVYNSEKYIRRCLDSVCGQTYTDLEVILVNDGSKDHSLSILQEYSGRDHRISLVSQENKGVAAARNTGLRNANGDYILYVDADDWIEPDAIECLVSRMDEDADIVFCSSDHAETPEDVRRESKTECEVWDQDRQLLEFMKHKRMTGMLWNKLIRKSIMDGSSFNEKTGYGEDAEFLWKVLKKSRKMVVTNEVLYHHVLEDMSISHLSFSEKKFSAIPMWEAINKEVQEQYPELLELAKERLMCAAVFSMYEMKQTKYHNRYYKEYIRGIVKENFQLFMRSPNVSKKMKLYAAAIRGGILKRRFL